jgi:hypothetical protein
MKLKSRLFYCTLAGVMLVTLTLSSCFQKEKGPNVDKVDVKLDFRRFDQELMMLDMTKIKDTLPVMQKRYGSFFEIFNNQIIAIGSSYDPGYPTFLNRFITDYTVTTVYQEVKKKFTNLDSLKNRLTVGFKHYKYYFPEFHVPIVVTYVSGLNQNMFATDSVLGIGIDKYLGANCSFYERMGTPKYIRMRFTHEKIASDAFFTLALSKFPLPDTAENVLSQMLYQGKLMYFVKKMLPDEPDSLVFGFTDKQVKWCHSNEKQMWTFLVEHKILFSTDTYMLTRYLDEAPSTKNFPPESPGRAAIWLGYRIVERYMQKNSETSLLQLMNNNDYMSILAASKYNP